LFLLSVVPRLSPFLGPFCPRNGRNFKRKFTNEGDFPCALPSVPLSRQEQREEEEEEEEEAKRKIALFRFPRFIINACPSRRRETFPQSFVSFFYLSLRPETERSRQTMAAKNEIPRFRQKFIFRRAIQSANNCFGVSPREMFQPYILKPQSVETEQGFESSRRKISDK